MQKEKLSDKEIKSLRAVKKRNKALLILSFALIAFGFIFPYFLQNALLNSKRFKEALAEARLAESQLETIIPTTVLEKKLIASNLSLFRSKVSDGQVILKAFLLLSMEYMVLLGILLLIFAIIDRKLVRIIDKLYLEPHGELK